IIAATNKNLFEEIKKGSFRKDLFFRLNINSISLPPLRERKGDIDLLAGYFLKKFNEKYAKDIRAITPAALNCLKEYSFPGNVRELMNIINSAVIVENSNLLLKKSLPGYFLDSSEIFSLPDEDDSLGTLDDAEKNYIQKVLHYTNNNRTKAAEILGISRVNLIAKIKKYNLV
ncbi:MAG: helix-turn-helix domain-containing protein, partial [Bacteroidota bacterium]|nr:helix-turn-helix domain-containing protein [Bacteroidota bacterium]